MAHSIPLARHIWAERKLYSETAGKTLLAWTAAGSKAPLQMMPGMPAHCKVPETESTTVPLPIMDQPSFKRIAMDMIGPLSRSKPGYRFILTVCDYGTCYPNATH